MKGNSSNSRYLRLKLHHPGEATLAGNIAHPLERFGLDSLWEVDVLDSLIKRLDRKRHGLEIPIRGDKYGRVIPVLIGPGEHVHGKLNINALLLEYAPVVYPAFLKKPQAKDHLLHCLDAGVIAPLGGDSVGALGVRRRYVVVENTGDPPSSREPVSKLGNVNINWPAGVSQPVMKVAAIYKNGNTVSGFSFTIICHPPPFLDTEQAPNGSELVTHGRSPGHEGV